MVLLGHGIGVWFFYDLSPSRRLFKIEVKVQTKSKL